MKSTDLIPGEIYILTLGGSKWIFRLDNIHNNRVAVTNRIYFNPRGAITYQNSFCSGWHDTNNMTQYSQATEEEKMWLQACEKVENFVPLSEVLEELSKPITYEIY